MNYLFYVYRFHQNRVLKDNFVNVENSFLLKVQGLEEDNIYTNLFKVHEQSGPKGNKPSTNISCKI